MTPAPSRGLAIEHFKCGNVLKICNRIIFDFYMGHHKGRCTGHHHLIGDGYIESTPRVAAQLSCILLLLISRTAYYLMNTTVKPTLSVYTQTKLREIKNKSYCSNQATNHVPTPDNTLIIPSIDWPFLRGQHVHKHTLL